ncbi:aldehyde ferredoxin oxidoreductase N-terminal domain-containing protein [Chloroflexota bacterium]
MTTFGYAGKTLRVDLSSGKTTEISTLDYARRFIGGRGVGAKIYWDEVSPDVQALDEENTLVFTTGPLAGIPGLGSSRWQVCGKSPTTIPQRFCYGNLGGEWGARLKSVGYDAIVIRGKSETPLYLLVSDEGSELRGAFTYWGRSSTETRELLKCELGRTARVVAIGPAGENMVAIANLVADNDASGSGGLGAVMGSKGLKAIAVVGETRRVNVAHPETLTELTEYFHKVGRSFGRVWGRWGAGYFIPAPRIEKDPCYGCLGRCGRSTYEAEDGRKGKFICQSAFFYQPWAKEYYGEWNDVPFFAARLCDDYGLDINGIDVIVHWLYRCYRAGIMNDENTGIPISKLGSLEFIETLVRKIALCDGFGYVLAKGILRAADALGSEARKLIADHVSGKAGQGIGAGDLYGPRLYITTALLHAMEPRPPIQQLHEAGIPVGKWLNWVDGIEDAYVSTDVLRAIARSFWGSEIAADFSTYEGKALAAKMIQDRQYAKECLILCDFLWPIMFIKHSEDHVGDPSLESKILSAVTGIELDEEGLYSIGEKVFNLQRAILVREGHKGRKHDRLPDSWHTLPLEDDPVNKECLVPGRGGEVVSRKGSIVDRAEFEALKDEYYRLRQWDVATGLQTRAKLEALGLFDIAEGLDERELIVSTGESCLS